MSEKYGKADNGKIRAPLNTEKVVGGRIVPRFERMYGSGAKSWGRSSNSKDRPLMDFEYVDRYGRLRNKETGDLT
jgi:hypothetical protein